MTFQGNLRLGVALAALLLVGCQRSSRAEAPPPKSAANQPAGADDAGAPVVITRAKLEAFVRYLRAMGPVQAQALQTVRALEKRADAGRDLESEALAALERRQRAEATARADAALTEGEVEAMSELVTAVLAKRPLPSADGGVAQQLTALRASLTESQAKELDAALSGAVARQAQLFDLSAERKRFGDGPVDAVLALEGELSGAWESYLHAASGRLRPAPKSDGG